MGKLQKEAPCPIMHEKEHLLKSRMMGQSLQKAKQVEIITYN